MDGSEFLVVVLKNNSSTLSLLFKCVCGARLKLAVCSMFWSMGSTVCPGVKCVSLGTIYAACSCLQVVLVEYKLGGRGCA